MKRFGDPTLVAILQKMRGPKDSAKLSDAEWRALKDAEVDVERLERDPAAFEQATAGWFEACYLWSAVPMASYARAILPARRHKEILFYFQAVGVSSQIVGKGAREQGVYERALGEPSLARTGRLPGIALLRLNMRVRLTTQVLPPWAVQDTTGTIMGINLSDLDRQQLKHKTAGDDDADVDSELCLQQLPKGIDVQLDKCDQDTANYKYLWLFPSGSLLLPRAPIDAYFSTGPGLPEACKQTCSKGEARQDVSVKIIISVCLHVRFCHQKLLPPQVCDKHMLVGFWKECSMRRAFEGWVLVEPVFRTWAFADPVTEVTFKMSRSQLPIVPEAACSLYSLPGATCDPGLVAHFVMRKRADNDIKWLIVYVLLSRVRSLSRLRSVGLASESRDNY